MTTIKLKNGSGAPTAGDLVQGEPALDLTNKRLYTENASGTVIEVGTNPTSITTGTITGSGDMAIDTNTLFVDVSANSVGIGTTSPSAELDIVGDATDAQIEVGNNVGQKLTITGGSSGIDFTTANALAMTFGTSGSERLRIDSSGEIGIGNAVASTINASSGIGNLVVGSGSDNEGITIYTGSSSYGALNFADATSGAGAYAGYIKFDHSDNSFGHFIDNVERVRIDSSGNVGIGTTSPAQELHIAGTEPNIRLDSGGTPAALYGLEITNGLTIDGYFRSRGATGETQIGSGRSSGWGGHLTFYTDTNERMRIDSSGNAVIGSTTAKTRLQVSGAGTQNSPTLGTIGTNVPLYLTNNDTAYGLAIGNSSSTGNAWLQAQRTDGTATAYNIELNPAGGSVGVQTSPNGFNAAGLPLVVGSGSGNTGMTVYSGTTGTGSLHFADGTSGSASYRGYVNYSHTNDSMAIGTAGAEALRINSSGRVGIGTASPSFGLSVESDNGSGYAALFRKSSSDPALTIQTTSGITQIQGLNSALTTTNAIAMQVSGGNVGIGTTVPTNAKLEVVASSGEVFRADASGGAYRIVANQTGVIMNGNVGIGTTSPGTTLHLSNSDPRITLTDTDAGGNFQIRNTSGVGYISTLGAHPMLFSTNSAEAMRIDASGNLLVGKTVSSLSTEGVTLGTSGQHYFTSANDAAVKLNRLTTDGEIAQFRKDSVVVGSADAYSSYLKLYGGSGSAGSGLWLANGAIYPVGTTNTVADAVTDIGHSSYRFQDLYLSNAAYLDKVIGHDDTNTYISFIGSDVTQFVQGGAEAMRISSSGTLLVNTTTTSFSPQMAVQKDSGGYVFESVRTGTGTEGHIVFVNGNGAVGTITSTGTSTAYGTSSDQRLKENIVDAPSASDDIDAIQVRSFDWRADGSHQKYGMVAQELQTVAPDAVTGDADSDEMMGVDYSKLVPMLVKEIQSLRARVAQLEGAN